MLNKELLKIEKENAFSRSSAAVTEYKKAHPDADIISLGIGDVSRPIPPVVLDAMKKAVDDLGDMKTFQGYGAYFGIPSLRRAIADFEYKDYGIGPEEIFVGDGTKSDCTNILELFDADSTILVGNPVYPIYVNGSHAYSKKILTAETDEQFKMQVPKNHVDIIYICSPCNPIGNAYTRSELQEWVNYANREGAVIIYDNVYNAFIESEDVPYSIYEIPGSKTCAVELRSYSKNISFSGTRCSYMVLPKEMGEGLAKLWKERTINRFNGASYIAQKGAEASYLPEAQEAIKANIKAYKDNAKFLREGLLSIGFKVIGGIDSPYLWVETPDRMECWDAFETLLNETQIVVIPGLIFGSKGKFSLRISSLGTSENSKIAVERLKKYYETK